MNARRRSWLAVAALAAATAAVYVNTFAVPFLFDDLPAIVQNPSIRQWSTALAPPGGFGLTVSGRPLLNLSFAANHAWGGFEVTGYHALNLLIHLTAGLVLFGLARRTLRQPVLAPAFGHLADPMAFALALWWTLHPLQTESVTYLVQRAESLMGLLFLLTLYGFVRATEPCHPIIDRDRGDAEGTRGAGGGWKVAAVAACLAGVATKEVMSVAPVVVLLYDRTFVAGNFRTAWRSRRGFYLALAATWLPLLWFVVGTGGDRGGTYRFTAAAFVEQWRTQGEALLIYLKLALWPVPLAFEYAQGASSAGALAAGAVVVAALLVVTIWALCRRPVAGFFGASFFLVLAPTSVLPGVTQTMAEHRMYLPLAAVLALACGGLFTVLGRRGLLVVLGLALGAGALTLRRNADYESPLTLWRDTVRKEPRSARAHTNLGTALYEAGEVKGALQHYEESLRLDPKSAGTHYNYGVALDGAGRADEAIAQCVEAVRLQPGYGQAEAMLGAMLFKADRAAEAVPHLQAAMTHTPDLVAGHFALGRAQAQAGEFAAALASFEKALQLQPKFAEAADAAGAMLLRLQRTAEAHEKLERALQLKPGLADAHYHLGLLLAMTGRADEARAHFADAARLDPDQADARLNLAINLAQAGRLTEALSPLQEAIRVKPELAEARGVLGNVLTGLGRIDDAIQSYGEALRLSPGDAMTHYNLGNALMKRERVAEARAHFAEAVRLAPGFEAARQMLQTLDRVSGGK